MTPKIYISRRVADLRRTRKFWTALGYDNFDEVPAEYRDKTLPLRLSESTMAVFMTRALFAEMNQEPLALPSPERAAESIVTLALESRGEVDGMTEKVLAAGGKEWGAPADLGFVYVRAFTDPDGHRWEFQWRRPPPG